MLATQIGLLQFNLRNKLNHNLNIAISSYRSAPFSGGQGIFIYELSKALQALGHNVDIISGPPYPILEPEINLIKSPGLDLFSTFVFKDRISLFRNKKNKSLDDWYEFVSALLGGFPEIKTFGGRLEELLRNSQYDQLVMAFLKFRKILLYWKLFIIQSQKTSNMILNSLKE